MNNTGTELNDGNNWQSDLVDMPYRREMIQHIVKILKREKYDDNNSSITSEWLNKLPKMAKQLELLLYKKAKSFDEYTNMNTLRNRLKQIAMEVVIVSSNKYRQQQQDVDCANMNNTLSLLSNRRIHQTNIGCDDQKHLDNCQQHQQQQQQQQYMNNELNGNWQNDMVDMPYRRKMIQHILKMLKEKGKNDDSTAPTAAEWLRKLPEMAKQLEVSLYRNAKSLEKYTDISTLRNRLQQIVIEVSTCTSSRKPEEGQGSNNNI